MDWLDDWLSGLVHRSGHSDLAERSRHERFIASRTSSAMVALAGLPPYLLGGGVPTALECLAMTALAAPFAGVLLLSRFGRLDLAQALVSLALTIFVAAAVATFWDNSFLAVLALLVVPLDALISGSRRAAIIAAVLSGLGVPLMAWLSAHGHVAGQGAALTTIFAVGGALGLGHALAQMMVDHRLKSLLRGALRAGEARESDALHSIDDLFTWHDRNGSVLRANTGAAKVVGVPASALHGRGLFNRIHVPDRPAFLKALSDAATATDAVVVQFRLQKGEPHDTVTDGNDVPARLGSKSRRELIWVEMRAHRLARSGADGSSEDSCAVVAVTRDISGHRQRADELEASRSEAERAVETRARLLATVSHELRTPLNAILGYSEILMGKADPSRDEHRQDYAEIIHHSGRHMLNLVSTLLDLSTIEAGHYELAPEPIEVAELVQDCCRFMGLAANRAGVVLAQDVTKGLPELRADRRACQQILLNLLSNSVKFTPKGGLVTVQARRDGDRIALTVRDTGVGVCHTELPHLGNPFYKAASGRSRPDKSAGLGLSVVRGLVALHDGQIDIASAPGDGTNVTVNLPIDAGSARRPAVPAPVLTLVRPADGVLVAKTG
jgi:cell cycle sensor histidine kinase DivJ